MQRDDIEVVRGMALETVDLIIADAAEHMAAFALLHGHLPIDLPTVLQPWIAQLLDARSVAIARIEAMQVGEAH